MRHARRVLGLVSLAVLVVGVTVLAAPVRRGYEAMLVVGDLVGRPLPEALDPRPGARRTAVTFEHDLRQYRADLYRAQRSAEAGIVFVPGAVAQGKDDPRVVNVAMALARAGFAVLVPDVVALRELRLLPESADDIAAALHWMLAQSALAPAGRLGLVTTSVAIGPAWLALLETPLATAVRFVVSIGGYHDLPRTLAYLTTGHYAAHGVVRSGAPSEYGKWIYALSNAARIENGRERLAFETLARRKLREPQADVSEQLADCGPVGRQVYAFIVNTEPDRSGVLLQGLPARLTADVAALDLASHDLSGMAAQVILVHGRDDDMIPYGESIGLASALAPGHAQLFLLAGFHHVETGARFADGLGMWRAVFALLGQRDS